MPFLRACRHAVARAPVQRCTAMHMLGRTRTRTQNACSAHAHAKKHAYAIPPTQMRTRTLHTRNTRRRRARRERGHSQVCEGIGEHSTRKRRDHSTDRGMVVRWRRRSASSHALFACRRVALLAPTLHRHEKINQARALRNRRMCVPKYNRRMRVPKSPKECKA